MSFDLKLQNGNLQIATNGDLKTVQNSDKLVQDVLKMVTTPAGANRMHIWYGSNFGNAIIGIPMDSNFSKDRATEQIISAIEILRTLQTSQNEYQSVSASEAIARVLNVSIDTDISDPRALRVSIAILNRAAVKTITGIDVVV